MEPAVTCEIERLPEELLSTVISLTSPKDACRITAVCRDLRATADSDAVWSCFLPADFPRFSKNELTRAPPRSSKGLFRRLAILPALLPGKLVCMWLDKATGAKCYGLSARALHIQSAHNSNIWHWTRRDVYANYVRRGKKFREAPKLLGHSGLEIHGKIRREMLSRTTTYAAYMVFKLAADMFYGLDSLFQEASVVGGAGAESGPSVRRVCLQARYVDAGGEAARKEVMREKYYYERSHNYVSLGEDVVVPRERADGWMEVELGRFYSGNGEDDDGEVAMSLTETTGGTKRGLIVRGFEIRTY